jgi:hypothetical protein
MLQGNLYTRERDSPFVHYQNREYLSVPETIYLQVIPQKDSPHVLCLIWGTSHMNSATVTDGFYRSGYNLIWIQFHNSFFSEGERSPNMWVAYHPSEAYSAFYSILWSRPVLWRVAYQYYSMSIRGGCYIEKLFLWLFTAMWCMVTNWSSLEIYQPSLTTLYASRLCVNHLWERKFGYLSSQIW